MSDHLRGLGPLQEQMRRDHGVCTAFYRLAGRQVMCGEPLDSAHHHDGSSHIYTSTACEHEQHGECRRICKFCMSTCRCACHRLVTL